ncbi:glutathione S-transferase omega-1-like [Protopterus annectens]|uniref:glutathione S-transferase omega-1-like n=1 Tax=Protopterus annectens TaxID=7888 RepID=UPI001CFC1923|nr:glutathione S-transferase omega-1-like [Protopterus annectens]
MSGCSKALRQGSPAPGPVPEGLIRIYSMRLCPYAQRTRIVLAAKRIKHEVININLKDKPDWFLKKNPFGVVPVLETPAGQILYESPITSDYLDEVYPGRKLIPSDPYEKAKQRIFLEHFSKAQAYVFRIPSAKQKGEDTSALEAEFTEKLKVVDQILVDENRSFFGGTSVSMTDYMIWPFVERLEAFGIGQ